MAIEFANLPDKRRFHQFPLHGRRPDAGAVGNRRAPEDLDRRSGETSTGSRVTSANSPGDSSRRWLWPLLLASPVLAVAGMLTHREVFPLLALAILVTLVMLPGLSQRQAGAWLRWSGLQAVLLTVAGLGFADLLLEAVPVVINLALAWLFARTLAHARPLIARCIVAVEGEARLHERGVALYARQLTALWAALLALNGLLLTVLLLSAVGTGVLARFGAMPSFRIDAWWASAWLNAGGYLLPAAVFAIEYPYRRWRLRHLQHLSLPQMLLRLVANWPRLLRDQDVAG